MTKIKKIKALLVSALLVITSVFCGVLTACNNGGNENGGGEISKPEPLTLSTSVETNENGENTYTITAIVNPSTLVPRWAIVWEDSTSEWAQGRDTADYLKLELSNGDKTATLSTKQAFGETALLTATISSPTGEVSVNKKVEYSLVESYRLSSDNTYYIVETGRDGFYTVGISSTYNGLPVNEIGNGAFCNCKSLVSVVIPDTIIKIGASAFQGCGSLSSVRFPRNVSFIGHNAFTNCFSLVKVSFEDTSRAWRFIRLNGDGKSTLTYVDLRNANSKTILNGFVKEDCTPYWGDCDFERV